MAESQSSTITTLEGTIIRNRWRIDSIIGKGSFGSVYLAYDNLENNQVAIKIEFPFVKKAVLKLEIAILKRLSCMYRSEIYFNHVISFPNIGNKANLLLACQHVCNFIAGGRFIAPHLLVDGQDANDFVYTYLVMSLLGSSISEIRKKQPNGSFSIPTTALLAIQMIRSIEAVHNTGVLHRDIKPGNFCIGLENGEIKGFGNNRPICHLIDFGLGRRYINAASGALREERSNVGFRGTARYASIAAHCGRELGRVDDLWSLFYMTVEFLDGTLPWKGKEKEKIGEYKQKYTQNKLVKHLPRQIIHLLHYLQKLEYSSCPDYDYIHSLFVEMFGDTGAPLDAVYDWDQSKSTVSEKIEIERKDTRRGVNRKKMEIDEIDQAGAATAAEPVYYSSAASAIKGKIHEINDKAYIPKEPRPPSVSAPKNGFFRYPKRIIKSVCSK